MIGIKYKKNLEKYLLTFEIWHKIVYKFQALCFYNSVDTLYCESNKCVQVIQYVSTYSELTWFLMEPFPWRKGHLQLVRVVNKVNILMLLVDK